MTQKKQLRQFAIFSLAFLSAFFAGDFKAGAAQISGSVTVDPNGTASTTVFKDITSLVTYLTTANVRPDGGPANSSPFGVSGALVVDIAAGTYIEQIDIPAITGASSTNTITLRGASKTTTIVSCTTATTSLRHTIRLNNTSWVILRDMTIRAGTSTVGWPVHVLGATNNCRVANCNIDFGATALTTQTSDNYAGVVMNNSTTALSIAGTFTNIDIDTNFIYGGQHSIWASGTATTSIVIRIRNNNADSANRYGFYFSGIGEIKCLNNLIENRFTSTSVSDGTGIFLSACNAPSGRFHEIRSNRIFNCESVGIHISTTNPVSTTPRNIIANNAIGGGFRGSNPMGIYLNSNFSSLNNTWDVFFNTVLIDNAATGTQAGAMVVLSCCSGQADIRNNHFIISNPSSSAIPCRANTYGFGNSVSTLNFNNYFRAGQTASSILVDNAGTTFTVSNFVNGGGYNANSISRNPRFLSNFNLLPVTPCDNGQAISGYTTDINSATRAATPDIGAYEYQATANDAGVTAIVGPAAPFNAGTQNVVLTLSNFGSTALTSTNISYSVNAAAPVTIAWTGTLAQCATTNITFSGANAFNFAPSTTYTIRGFTSSPNGSSDGNTLNDTTTLSGVGTAMSGNYTIDAGSAASSTNFQSFTAAANALSAGGVNGPVNITVVGSTPYVEQPTFSVIPGASATNTITIDGGTGNAANRILSFNFPTTPTNFAVMRLNGADYMRIKNLTIRSTSTSWGYGVLFTNQADYNIVDSCIIDLTAITNTSTANSAGICFSAASNNTTSQGNNGNFNIIRNNQIIGGASGGPARGISVMGSTQFTMNTDNQFINNTITNFFAEGIFLTQYLNNTIVRANSISRPNRTSSTTIWGINATQFFQNIVIEGNRIFNPFGGQLTSTNAFYGIGFQSNFSAGNRIVNNAIFNVNGNGIHYGLYLFNNYNQPIAIYHNTVSMDFATAKPNTNADFGIWVQFVNSGGQHDFRNNMVTLRRGGSTNAQRYAMFFQDFFANNTISNNNLFFVNGAGCNNQVVRFNSVDYASLPTWRASNSNAFDQASVSLDPIYANIVSDVTPTSCGVNNLGASVSGVTTDLNGVTRGTIPDIGAIEFNVTPSANNGALTGFSSLTNSLCAGGLTAAVTLKNEGTANITSAKIDWRINGTNQSQVNWSGTLTPGNSVNVNLGTANFTANASNTISAFLSEVNSTTDGCLFNDTITTTGTAAMNGVYTINASGSGATNFTSFPLAVAALASRGVCGPVTFEVASGTYTLSSTLSISAVAGASATNTITFDGGTGNAATRILQYATNCCSNTSVVRFDNSQWIRFRNLTVQSTGTSWPWVFHVFNNSSNIQIRNCVITNTATLTNQTNEYFTGVMVGNNLTCTACNTSNSTNLDIDSNTFTNLWFGIYLFGNTSGNINTGINIRNNTFTNTGNMAIYLYYVPSPVITSNNINMRVGNGASASSSGIVLDVCLSTSSARTTINRNIITNAALYGINLNNSGGSASTLRPQLINNAIGGGFTNTDAVGIRLNSTNAIYWDVYHNSVNLDNAASGTNAAALQILNLSSATFNDIRNNNLAVTNASATALCYRSSSGATATLNGNNYFKQGAISTTNIINVTGTNYTPSNFTTVAGANSINAAPSFTSATNLLPTSGTNNGVQILAVTTDIRDSIRNNPPDIGAYELPTTATLDLGIVSLVTPDTTLPMGSYNVAVRVRNFAATAITGFTLKHTVNGTNMQDTVITGLNLAQYDTLTVNMGSGKQATFGLSANTFRIYLENINGAADSNRVNDTISIGPRWPSLSGTFTINPSGSGPNNFTTFASAITALNNGGVSGPVTFNVSANTFNEQITINAVPGASSIRTVTFNGSGTANTILNFNGASTPNSHTLRLNGSQWITFQQMTLRGGGTTANWVVHMTNNAANCTIKNCRIQLTGAAATSTSSNFNAIVVNFSTTSLTTTNTTTTTNIVIDSNVIEGGFYGILLSSWNQNSMNFIRGNTFTNVYYTAIYTYFYVGYKILNNSITMRSGFSGSRGIEDYLSGPNLPLFNELSGNRILNAGQYGIYINNSSGSNNASTPGLMYNNMIGGGFSSTQVFGLALVWSNRWRVWHNTVAVDNAPTSASHSLFVDNGSALDIRNNIFAVTDASATNVTPATITTSSAVSTFNFNNYFNAGGSTLLSIGGPTFNSSTFRAAYPNGGGLNSSNLNPNFVSSTDLHINEACMNGQNLGITTDIDGNNRSTTPDMGSDEMTTIPALDASVLKINTPVHPYSTGNQTVSVTLQNNGSVALNRLTVAYSVNNGTPVVQNISDTIQPCDTLRFNFTTQHNFGAGPNTIKIYVYNPNNSTDANLLNDTLTVGPFCTPMNGTYTINPSGSGAANYVSFTAALSALQCGGISGPVVFNVSAGTYNEQISFVPVLGASATNTITFQSATGVASSVTVSSASGSENFVINFNGADFFRIRNITITNSGNTSGFYNVVQFTNSADNNELRGCVLSNAVPTSGNLVNVNNSRNSNIKFAGCTFIGGSYGIFWQSITSSPFARILEIDTCTFTNQNNYGIYVYYQDSVRIRNNTITTNSSNTNYYGINAIGTFINNFITNNTITGFTGGFGISLNSFGNNGNAGNISLVANNIIQGGSGTSTAYGLFSSFSNFTHFLHNTVNLTSTSGVCYPFFSNSTLQSSILANNIFQSTSTGTGSYALYNSGSFSSCTINNNAYFVAAGNLGFVGSTNRADITALRTGTGQDVNSFSRRADFISSTNLRLNSPCFDNLGTNSYLSFVGTDIDGQTRNASTPDVGAYEYSATAFDAQVRTITAPTAYSGSAQTVSARIINRGSTTITSVALGYNVNDGSVTSQTFTGLSLAPCDSTVLTFTTQVSLPGGLSVLKVFINGQINGSNNDASASNDTANTSFCNSLAGTFTINGAASVSATNFASFASAIAAMRSCGLSGAVTFNVAAGTYNEQVNIVNIPGVSATNTITFNGADSATTIIQFNATNSNARHVVMIDSCRHVTFRNFEIINTNTTNAWGIHLRGNVNSPTDSIRIARCTILIPFSTNTNFNGIVLSNNLTSPTVSGSYNRSITIDSCTLSGGYYGISFMGVNTSIRSAGLLVRGNRFMNNYWGNRFEFANNPIVTGNTIENTGKQGASTFTSVNALYFINCDSVKVTRNRIFGAAGGYGIFMQSLTGATGAENVVANNMIQIGEATNFTNAIYMSSVSFPGIYYNSVNVTTSATSTNANALTLWSVSSTRIVNNNFVSTGSTAPYLVYYPTGGIIQSNNNNYFGQGTQMFNGISTITAFRGTLHTGSDNNSKSVAPFFVSSTNLRTPSNIDLDSAGVIIPAVTIDFEGNPRNTVKPDIGCVEFAPPTENTGAIAITSPVNPVAPGLRDVHVVIRNFGPSVITSDTVVYTDGTVTHKILWTGSLATNATDTVRFTATSGPGSSDQRYNFTGNVTLTAYTMFPNGVMDGFTSNDTVNVSFCGAMSGTYTINPSGSGATNFTTFTAAVNQLACGGVSGPVTFNVSNGVYNEQVSIGTIIGASSTNTIRFQSASGVASNVTLQTTGTSLNNFTLRFNGADFVTIDKITITNLSSSFGRVVDFSAVNNSNNSINNTLTGCVLTGPSTTSSSDVLAVIYSNNTLDSNTTITGCTINRGSYGIFWNGNSTTSLYTQNLTITGNTFGTTAANANWWRGAELNNTFAPQIISNVFNAPSGNLSHMCIRLNNSNGSGRINKNRVTASGSNRGISLQNINVGQATGFDVVNNAISINSTTTAYGIELYSAANTNVYFNTVNSQSSGGNSSAFYSYSNNSATQKGNTVYNNNFIAGSQFAVYLNGSSNANAKAMLDSCNYNNIFSTGTNVAFITGASAYTSLSTFKGAVHTGSDASSITSAGSFTSSTNLAPGSNNPLTWNINNMGFPIGAVTDDINGANRSSTVGGGAPDIGAFTFSTPSATAPAATITGSHSVNGTEEIFYANKKVAEITWGSAGTLPSITANFFPGVWPDTVNVGVTGAKFSNAYWKVDATGGSGYSYSITLFYDPAQLGTIAAEADARMVKRPGTGNLWQAFTGTASTVNVTNKTVTVTGLTSFSEFALTDENNPLPVEWLNVQAVKAGNDVVVNWATAAEINNDRFEVERAVNGTDFEYLGEVKGAGNSADIRNYFFTDKDAATLFTGTVYYRLKQVDYNNTFEYSKVVAVSFDAQHNVKGVESVYPNPFNSYVNIQIATSSDEDVPVTITDQLGKVVWSGSLHVSAGSAVYNISALDHLPQGMYVVSLKGKSFSSQHKVSKF